MRASIVLVSVLCLACSGTARHVDPPPPPPPAPDAGPPVVEEPIVSGPVVPEDDAAPEGPACTRTDECARGLACRGPAGCTAPWACGTPRETCGPDVVSYCDCDGVTFHAPAGCPGRSYSHVGPCGDPGIADASYGLPDGDEPITSQDRTCTSNADCRGGEICFGAIGCGMEWRCERARGCARGGRATFCSCDGETFTAQTHCPGRPYAHRGTCDEAIAVTEAPMSRDPQVPAPRVESPRVEPRPPTASAPRDAVPLAPGTCHSNRDCARGEVCAGGAGCGDAWTCVRRTERCNPDTQYFCDCEGHSFTASMTCPTRPYAHRGSCAIDQVIDLAGAALR